MINLTEQERQALHNNRQEFYKLTLVDKQGVEKCQLEMLEGSIQCNKDRAIQKTGTLKYRVPTIVKKVEDVVHNSTVHLTSIPSSKIYSLGIETNGMLYTVEVNPGVSTVEETMIRVQDNGVLYTETIGTGEVEFQLIDSNGYTWNVGVEKEVIFTERTDIPQKIFYRDELMKIDYLNDRVKVWMGVRIGNTIRWWSKGLYLNIQPKIKNGIVETSIYDETIIVQRTRILDPKVFLKGTNYVEVLSYLLGYCGIIKMNIEPTDLVLQTDVELNSKKNNLEWFNYYANQINYTNLTVDDDGFFISRKYVEPTPLNVGYIYEANDMSVITGDLDAVLDNYNIPNVFRRIVAHPQLGELVSTYINDDPTDPYSVVNTTMNYNEETVDNVSGQIELDNIARKAAWQAKQITQEISFQTLNMPHHTTGDILDLRHPEARGIVVENAWSMSLKAGAKMTHKVKRLVSLSE